MTMERVQSTVFGSSAVHARGSDSSLALANRGWGAFNAARLPALLPPSAATDDAPWREADRALAEIREHARRLGDTSSDRAMLVRATIAVRDSLLEAAQAAAEASRRARLLAEMLDKSLAALANEQGERPALLTPLPVAASVHGTSLSEREREVLLHVAKGRSNRAIAEKLFVSPNTVKTHVSSLLRKLNATSRAQLATIAVQQGLC